MNGPCRRNPGRRQLLRSRIRAVLRRSGGSFYVDELLTAGRVRLDRSRREVTVEDQPVELTFSDDVKLKDALTAKAWETRKPDVVEANFASMATQGPSIGGLTVIMKNAEEKQRQNENTLTNAFQDLNALMNRAKEMVALAQSLAGKLSRGDTAENASFQGIFVQQCAN